jgi:hypothetical protein
VYPSLLSAGIGGCFLAHLAAMMYFNECRSTDEKKIGGMARAVSCKHRRSTDDPKGGEGHDVKVIWTDQYGEIVLNNQARQPNYRKK